MPYNSDMDIIKGTLMHTERFLGKWHLSSEDIDRLRDAALVSPARLRKEFYYFSEGLPTPIKTVKIVEKSGEPKKVFMIANNLDLPLNQSSQGALQYVCAEWLAHFEVVWHIKHAFEAQSIATVDIRPDAEISSMKYKGLLQQISTYGSYAWKDMVDNCTKDVLQNYVPFMNAVSAYLKWKDVDRECDIVDIRAYQPLGNNPIYTLPESMPSYEKEG